ncbi:hypothetical protein [Pelosinus fermentans]|uniref:hypothetical protein n=1 Tax=Pelosinus fermentans TaxID=365349 RepID=UPI0005F7DD43|nr:hypothetical protein [Pelosinus fermentans]
MASSATPLVNGTATAGADNGKFAREGHIHPTDTTRAALASPTFTGIPAAPTATVGTNTTQIATTAFVQANKGAGTNVWLSSEYTYTSNTPLIVSHGLTLTPLNCRVGLVVAIPDFNDRKKALQSYFDKLNDILVLPKLSA